jgi:hypothetical protein
VSERQHGSAGAGVRDIVVCARTLRVVGGFMATGRGAALKSLELAEQALVAGQ